MTLSAVRNPVPTINHDAAVEEFTLLMTGADGRRVLRLIGEGKMGKSHFLTRVFPLIAEQDFGARCAVVDLRNQAEPIPSLLYQAVNGLGPTTFGEFELDYLDWRDRPAPQGVTLEQALSRAAPTTGPTQDDLRLTALFVDGLQALNGPTVLFFDAIDQATPNTQTWLVETLAPRLLALPTVKVVLGGRQLPDTPAGYVRRCCECQLQPVTDEQAYINYCRQARIELAEQSIRDFARAFDYVPGQFTGYAWKFRAGAGARG